MTLLKADHREAKRMLEQLANSEPGGERADVLAQLVEALSLHMTMEEALIYPKAADVLEPQEAEEAEIEHGLAREGLTKLQEMVDVPGFGAAVDMLKGGILHHVHEEETELLPELKGAMDREEWLAIGDAIVEAKAAAGTPVSTSGGNAKAKASSGGRSKARK
jgi:hypothetical protein